MRVDWYRGGAHPPTNPENYEREKFRHLGRLGSALPGGGKGGEAWMLVEFGIYMPLLYLYFIRLAILPSLPSLSSLNKNKKE